MADNAPKVLEATVAGLLACYLAETGSDLVWGVVRRLLGPECTEEEEG